MTELSHEELTIQAARILTKFENSKRGTIAVSNEEYQRFFEGCKPVVVSHLNGKVFSLALDRKKAIAFLTNKFGLHNVNNIRRDTE